MIEVIRRGGGQTALAAKLGLTKMAINYWKRVPDRHVRKVAYITGIGMKRLRPDLYDPNYSKNLAVTAGQEQEAMAEAV